MQFSLDITVHHFGQGRDGLRDYAKKRASVNTAGSSYVDVMSLQHAAYFLQLQLYGWTPADDDWWGATADLRGPDGRTIGIRPVLVYGKPYDIPVHAAFKLPDGGDLFSLALRTVSAG